LSPSAGAAFAGPELRWSANRRADDGDDGVDSDGRALLHLISVRFCGGRGIRRDLSVESNSGSRRWNGVATFFSHLVRVPSVWTRPSCGMTDIGATSGCSGAGLRFFRGWHRRLSLCSRCGGLAARRCHRRDGDEV